MLGLGLGISYRGGALRPALDFNLLSGALDSRVTFARASAAWGYNSAGVLTSHAINAPRFDYDPSTLAPKGLLIEEARTNSALWSEDLSNVAWSKLRTTVTANAVAAPDGAVTADKLTEATDVATTRNVGQNISVTSGTTYTFSVFAKAAERSAINLRFSAGFAAGNVTFDLTGSGTATNGGTVASSAITAVNGGWYRCSASFVATSTTTAGAQVFLYSGSITYDGVSGNGVYLWGGQVEAGAFVTSYVQTTTASATRAVDVAPALTSAFAFNDTEGTLFVVCTPVGVGSGLQTAIYLDDNTANERMGVRSSAATNSMLVVDNGASQANAGIGTLVAGTRFKAAFAYRANDFAGCMNGGAVATDTIGTIPTVTKMQIGSRTTGTEVLSGWYERAAYYNRRLSDATLIRITA